MLPAQGSLGVVWQPPRRTAAEQQTLLLQLVLDVEHMIRSRRVLERVVFLDCCEGASVSADVASVRLALSPFLRRA